MVAGQTVKLVHSGTTNLCTNSWSLRPWTSSADMPVACRVASDM